MVATLPSFQVVVRCPDVSIRVVFIVTLVRSEDISDFNVNLELAVYFVTATINGHASFQFHPDTAINGPVSPNWSITLWETCNSRQALKVDVGMSRGSMDDITCSP